ncbi:MAG: COG1361 S-layer family protein [Halobacteriales archaeon]
MRYIGFLAGLLVLAPLAVGAVGAQDADVGPDPVVQGEPEFELGASDNRFEPGEAAELTITPSNNGHVWGSGPEELRQRVQTARNTRFEVEERRLHDDISVHSGAVVAGSVPEGSAEPISFQIELDEDIRPGTYDVPVEISYDYTRRATYFRGYPRYTDSSKTERETVTVVVEDDAHYRVVDSSTEGVQAGDDGRLHVDLENTGTRTAHDPRVTFTTTTDDVYFGSPDDPGSSRTVSVDDIEPDETREVSVRTGATSSATAGGYGVDVEVAHENDGGVVRRSRPMRTSVDVEGEQNFTVSDVESTLEVGDEGTIEGTVTNEGPSSVDDAVLVFQPSDGNVDPRETEYSLGDFEAGETRDFSYRVSVSSEAEEAPKQSTMNVRYRNEFDDTREQDVVFDYDVAGERDEFELDSNMSVAAGESDEVEVEVTNTDPHTYTDVQAKMFTDSPLDSADDEAFISEIEPGETETVVFDLSASGGAQTKTYGVSFDFRYDDERNDTKVTDTYREPVDVTPAEAGVPWALVAIVILLGGGAYYWKKR